MANRQTIRLSERRPKHLRRSELSEELAVRLSRKYPSAVTVEFPTPLNGERWTITSQGWIGYLPVSPECMVEITPRIQIDNLFRMLEYAYRLKSFQIFPGVIHVQSIEAFFDRLARVLADLAIARRRRGLYREYVPAHDELPYVRGRVNFVRRTEQPWRTRLDCEFEEHTANIADNQIIAYCLKWIAKSGRCSQATAPHVRRAYRMYASEIDVPRFDLKACIGRFYNRLNQDYEPIHGLCRFFLEHAGPRLESGDHTMPPFAVNMDRLFEMFVAEWLAAHLPPSLRLKAQESVQLDRDNTLRFSIDLVIYDREKNTPRAVLDTKYKRPKAPDTADVAQAVAYAESKSVKLAALIYPEPLPRSSKIIVGQTRVETLEFDLTKNLEESGPIFLAQLMTLMS
ncbi:MAG: 5-methylcytosine restriction system component-like protein [Capsulimonas sp.]|nr:5-methylcytosine restriction system component-like protein [Capsulimonas sp.]